MPYKIRPKDGKFEVYNTETGKVKGTHNLRGNAEAQLRLLEAVKAGWKPSKKGSKK